MQSNFRSKIQTLLPKLRKNEASPVELTELILEYNTSPYEKETFFALLNTRQKEIETAEYIIYNNNFGSTTFFVKEEDEGISIHWTNAVIDIDGKSEHLMQYSYIALK